jgi:hypothetical protein
MDGSSTLMERNLSHQEPVPSATGLDPHPIVISPPYMTGIIDVFHKSRVDEQG